MGGNASSKLVLGVDENKAEEMVEVMWEKLFEKTLALFFPIMKFSTPSTSITS